MEDSTKKIIDIPSIIKVKDFATKLNQPVAQVIKVLLENGFIANINQTLDFETASLIASEFDYQIQKKDVDEKNINIISPIQLADILNQEKEKNINLEIRPPIVTILGHVDHGKTTLLDTIRKTNVAAKESGGITQHITAYQVKTKNRLITFIDTPGHEAFSQMRARGADISDIAILIVSACDGVQKQTKEIIENLKAGNTPLIVAINKIDKENANPEMVKNQLAEAGILLEKRGGNIPYVEISAKNNINIDELLETIILQADILELKADFQRRALGIVLESHLDQRKGALATVIIKTGTLKEGDSVIAGEAMGNIRQILDYNNKKILNAGPSTPITIIGLDQIAKTGVVLQVEESKGTAKEKARRFKLNKNLKNYEQRANVQKINEKTENEQPKHKLNIIIKADMGGSSEALTQILSTINQEEVTINVLQNKVGNITENDILLAQTTNAIVYGFKVMIPDQIKKIAQKNKVSLKIFDVIYKLVENVKEELSQLLPPEIVKLNIGKLEVLKIFRTEKNKMIIGGKIKEGKIQDTAFFDIVRDNQVIGEGKVTELKHNQDKVSELKSGNECGVTYMSNQGPLVKIEEHDTLILYIEEKKVRKIL